jgi:hypothetical protein
MSDQRPLFPEPAPVRPKPARPCENNCGRQVPVAAWVLGATLCLVCAEEANTFPGGGAA